MKNRKLLERVTVGFRCPMDWEKMAGEEQARFCDQCQKSVTDLSQMTTEEVESYLREEGPKGTACVRIWRDENGKLITKGCGSTAAQGQRLVKRVVTVGMATSGLAAAACSSHPESGREIDEQGSAFRLPPFPEDSSEAITGGVVTMGVICLPPETE